MPQRAEDRIRAAVAALESAGCSLRASDAVPWIVDIEERFGRPLPPDFRHFLTHFIFEEFDIGGVTLFANLGDGSSMDLTIAPFSDPYMSPWLISHGFVQIGRPNSGSYDPVCLACESASDPEVVQLDHEDILQERPTVKVRRLAGSFLDLLERGYAC